jgi:lipoyl(octanoyl) transferase
MINKQVIFRKLLGLQPYQDVWQKMHDFTATRDVNTTDEIWLLEHFPVFTQGQAGRPEHILNPSNIPIVATDRGGQVTYHGPGQLIAYPLINLRRLNIGVKKFVHLLEQSVIDLLSDYGVVALAKEDAPGVYVGEKKICSIGLKISRGCSYHGIALNVDMDLKPFSQINPCGFRNLRMTQIKDFVPQVNMEEVQSRISKYLMKNFNYEQIIT